MLILQLNSEEAAADKVPIAIGIGTEPRRWGPISPLAFGASRLSPHSTGKSNYLEQGTRERSLWHLWFILMAILWRGWMRQYCSTAVHQRVYPWPQQSSRVHPATGFSGGFSCEILIGTEAGFGRELYSPSLHRTESSGTAPNPTSEHNSSHPSHHIFDYPGNNQPLIWQNLLPVNPSYLLILLYLAWPDDYCARSCLPYPLSSHLQQSQGSAIILPPSSQSYSAAQDQAHQLLH